MLAEGCYWGVPKRWGLGESSKGTPYFFVECDVSHIAVDSRYDALPAPELRTLWFYLSDAAMDRSALSLKSLGFNGDFTDPQIGDEARKGIDLVCKHELYDGTNRDKWNLAADQSTFKHKAPSTDQIARVNALYRAAGGGAPTPPASKAPQPTPAQAAPVQPEPTVPVGVTTAPAPAPPTGDDIPF